MFFFVFFSIDCPSPHRRIRDMELFECSCSKVYKKKRPCVHFKPNDFGLINVYRNVYSHGYQMVNLFSSNQHSNNDFEPNIAQEIRLLTLFFSWIHTMVLKADIWQWPRILNHFVRTRIVLIVFFFVLFFDVASHSCQFLLQSKDLGLWYLVREAPANGCICRTVNLHHQMIHVSVSLYVAKALLYQQLYSFQF